MVYCVLVERFSSQTNSGFVFLNLTVKKAGALVQIPVRRLTVAFTLSLGKSHGGVNARAERTAEPPESSDGTD